MIERPTDSGTSIGMPIGFGTCFAILFTLLMSLNSCSSRNALTPDWEQFPSHTSENEQTQRQLLKLTTDSQGNLLSAGTTQSAFGKRNRVLFVHKQTPSGAQLWSITLDIPNDEETVTDILTDEEDSIYLAGKNLEQNFLLKLSRQGKQQWLNHFGTVKSPNLCKLADKIVVGSDAIRVFDETGAIQSEFSQSTPVTAMNCLSDGTLLTASATSVERFDSAGKQIWRIDAPHNTSQMIRSLELSDNRYALAFWIPAENALQVWNLSQQGEINWQQKFSIAMKSRAIKSAPLLLKSNDQQLVLAISDRYSSFVAKISHNDGRALWQAQHARTDLLKAAVVDDGGNIFLFGGSQTQMLNSDGELVEERRLPGNAPFVTGDMALGKDGLFVANSVTQANQSLKIYTARYPLLPSNIAPAI